MADRFPSLDEIDAGKQLLDAPKQLRLDRLMQAKQRLAARPTSMPSATMQAVPTISCQESALFSATMQTSSLPQTTRWPRWKMAETIC